MPKGAWVVVITVQNTGEVAYTPWVGFDVHDPSGGVHHGFWAKMQSQILPGKTSKLQLECFDGLNSLQALNWPSGAYTLRIALFSEGTAGTLDHTIGDASTGGTWDVYRPGTGLPNPNTLIADKTITRTI